MPADCGFAAPVWLRKNHRRIEIMNDKIDYWPVYMLFVTHGCASDNLNHFADTVEQRAVPEQIFGNAQIRGKNTIFAKSRHVLA